MKIKIYKKYNVPILVYILCFFVLICLSGCLSKSSVNELVQVPFYKYPNKPHTPNIILKTIITDPSSKYFYQGKLLNSNSSFVNPHQTVVGADGTIYILDNGKGQIFKLKYDDKGKLITSSIITPKNRVFPSIIDLIITPNNLLWFTDSQLKKVFILSLDGVLVDSISHRFSRPVGLAYNHKSKSVFISDLMDNSISEFDLNWNFMKKYDAELGLDIETPSYLAVDNDGNIFVNETLNAQIKVFTPDWKQKQIIGGLGDGPGYFFRPKSIAIDKKNRIYVLDGLFDNVQIFDSNGTLLLTFGTTGSGIAEFRQPMGITIDDEQRIIIADSFNRRIQIFELVEE